MTQFAWPVDESSVRDLLTLNDAGVGSRITSGAIGSNIRAASGFLEHATRRWFHNETGVTRKFSTQGQTYMALPGLRNAGTVSRAGSDLTVDESYYLIPDDQQSGVFTAIQFGAFGQRPYWAYPDWFDTNKDHRWFPWGQNGSLPNDLVFTNSDWGYTDAIFPEAALHACKILSAFYCLRPDALLSGARVTATGAFDLSDYPLEVTSFIRGWRLGNVVASVG